MFRVVVINRLLTLQCQVTVGIDDNFFTLCLCAFQCGVVAAVNRQGFARVHRGISGKLTVAFLEPFALIYAGVNIQTGTARTKGDAHSHRAAFAAVFTVHGLRVLRRSQGDIILCLQGKIAARLQLTAGDRNITAVRRFSGGVNGQIIPRTDTAALCRGLPGGCFRR